MPAPRREDAAGQVSDRLTPRPARNPRDGVGTVRQSGPMVLVHDVAPDLAHAAAVDRLVASFAAVPPGSPVRLAKRTSNLFRPRQAATGAGLDASGLDGVLHVDPVARTADVQGMCTYEDLVAATLPHGLAPLVVPQLRTITLGGAVTGLGIESTSFRHGLPHESVLELDVLTGAGEVVTARPEGEHAELFAAFPNSYGALGYATRLRIELRPVGPAVLTRNVRFDDLDDLVAAVGALCADPVWDGEPVDYLDGVVVGPSEAYLVLGRDAPLAEARAAGPPSDYTGQQIYYRSLGEREHRRPHRARLPVALGHRLVLVLARLRGAAPGGAPALAAALPAQRRLPPDRRLREPAPRGGDGRPLARAAGARAGGAGRRDPARPHGGLPALVPARGARRAGLAVPGAAAGWRRGQHLAALPARPHRGVRQRGLLGHGADRARVRVTVT